MGEKFSIADIANYSWVNISYFSGVQLSDFPNLEKWWKRIGDRPAVQKGITVPGESSIGNKNYLANLEQDPEAKKKDDELKELAKKAKEQYGYKYSSP